MTVVHLLFALLTAAGAASGPAHGEFDPSSTTEPSAEEVPHLLAMVAEQQAEWIWADFALGRSRDPRIVPFYIDLLQNNFYEKEADGTRAQYGLMVGGTRGCVVVPFLYGGVLARRLGEAGDSQAIPVLREAVEQGDHEVAGAAYRSLYKLGALQLNDLFALARPGSGARADVAEILGRIASETIHSDPSRAIDISDRVIAELPQHVYQVASAHYLKIQCFEILGRFGDALHEVDEVLRFPQFENLTRQMAERRSRLEALRSAGRP